MRIKVTRASRGLSAIAELLVRVRVRVSVGVRFRVSVRVRARLGLGLGLVMTVQFMTVQIKIGNHGSSPHFLAHVYCGQMAGWIKMPLGTQVGLSAGDFVLDDTYR